MKFILKFKPNKKKVFSILKNRYFITSFIFLMWVGFLDQNNLIYTSKARKELRELKENRDYYLQEIGKTRQIKSDLMNNKNTLEKFARENHYMRKPGEEVIVIEFQE